MITFNPIDYLQERIETRKAQDALPLFFHGPERLCPNDHGDQNCNLCKYIFNTPSQFHHNYCPCNMYDQWFVVWSVKWMINKCLKYQISFLDIEKYTSPKKGYVS